MALGGDLQGQKAVKPMRGRLVLMIWAVAVVFVILIARLYTLQVLRGEELSSKGRRNFVQSLPVPHDRGIIYDRYARILVDNRATLDVQVTPAFLGAREEMAATLRRLADYTNLTEEEAVARTEAVRSKVGLERFRPVLIKRDLTPEQVEVIEANRSIFQLDGVDIVEGRQRTYPYGPVAAHVLGYVNEIDPGGLELERARGNPRNYELGDLIGRDGMERTWEAELRGIDGEEQVVVDAKGRVQHDAYVATLLGQQRRRAPQPGHNLFLTIDLDLQRVAEESFVRHGGRAGAVVAVDPRDGSVLAMASIPAFDPNRLGGASTTEEKARIDADPLKPWVNRAVQGQYAPGSTFKVFTALAALGARATSDREQVRCPGFYRMGRHVWRCHKDSGHGLVSLREALKFSCDTFFYTMGGRVGIDAIAQTSRMFGLGERSTVALQGEKPGLAPDEAFHNRVDAATGGYQRGMAINTSIGQGSVLVTPVQLAMAYASIANGGSLFTPQLIARIETADFRVIRRVATGSAGASPVSDGVEGQPARVLGMLEAKLRRTIAFDPEHLAALREGLIAVMTDPGGTGYWRRSRKVTMAGKTGTSQVVRMGRERVDKDDLDYLERDHALFVAYAPAEEPRIVVAVINEHSGHGSSNAAPIAVDVIDAFVDLEAQRSQGIATRDIGSVP